MSESLLAELLDPATRADPFPLYARIRAAGPLALPSRPAVVFAGHADCLAVLRSPAASSDRRNATMVADRLAEMARRSPGTSPPNTSPSFLFLDPPDHARLRRLVSSAFTPHVISRLQPLLTTLIDDLLDAAAERGSLDVLSELAYPVPVAAICALLGVPERDEPRIHAWSELLARSLDPMIALTGEMDPDAPARMRAGGELREYMRELARRRRREPGDDLLSGLIRASDDGLESDAGPSDGGLSEDEVISTCVLLLIAGHETTVNLIANGALALLRAPDQWAALAGDPSRGPRVVEETLRYDPPVHLVGRVAREEMHVGGVMLPPGAFALLLIGGTGRDPAVAPHPDSFDPERPEVRTLSFGMGPHFCIGAPLARLEGRLVLSRLTQRVVGAKLIGEVPRYKANISLRGVLSLPVAFERIAPRTTPWR
jgi:cytochrome P450